MIRRGEYIAFCGALGSGKTLNMTRLAAMDALDGRRVFANYPTTFAEPILSIRHLYSIRDSLICLDELQSTMDSREFKKVGDLAQWILIVRKLGCSVLYTTQAFTFVDTRVRQITSYLYQCEAATWSGGNATMVELYKINAENAKLLKKFLMPHSEALYGLYDSFDYQVKLTEDGRVASFGGGDSAPAGAVAQQAPKAQIPARARRM